MPFQRRQFNLDGICGCFCSGPATEAWTFSTLGLSEVATLRSYSILLPSPIAPPPTTKSFSRKSLTNVLVGSQQYPFYDAPPVTTGLASSKGYFASCRLGAIPRLSSVAEKILHSICGWFLGRAEDIAFLRSGHHRHKFKFKIKCSYYSEFSLLSLLKGNWVWLGS